MAFQIREILPEERSEWDRFVLGHPGGSPFHLFAWRETLAAGFPGYKPIYLAGFNHGIQAVLPLYLVRNLLIGKALISSPFAVYGGVLAASGEAREAMGAYAARLARDLGVGYAEFRNRHTDQRLGFAQVSRYVTFVQPLGATEAEILEAIPRKTRYMVRKALKHGFTTRTTRDPRAFERLYLSSLRRLGTPAFPRRHFTAILENFGEQVDIREVVLDGKVVASVMTFYFRDQVLPYYGASDPAYNEYAPNNYMYFDQMRWAARNGYALYDFGRSKKESGSFEFKAHWGMRIEELPYETLLIKRKELPNYSPNNPRFRLALKLWQRVPLPVTRCIGPWLLRLVP